MLKLISINTQGDVHLDLVLPFLEKEEPDILCMQEVFEKDFLQLQNKFSMDGLYAPTMLVGSRDDEKKLNLEGVGMLSRLPTTNKSAEYYYKSRDVIKEREALPYDEQPRVLVSMDIETEGNGYSVATTHFTWSDMAQVTEKQKKDLKRLLDLLDGRENLILAGDFNAPRGGEIFSAISERYKDNIPQSYTTSIDKNFHRKGDIQVMVDGLFTTKDVKIDNVKLIDGLGDHMAVVAQIG